MEEENKKQTIFSNYNKSINNTIIFMVFVLFVYCYFGSFSFFERYFSYVQEFEYWKIIYHNISVFVLFFVFGLIFSKLIQKDSLKEMGLSFGNWKLGLILCAIATVVCPLLALSTVLDADMTATYPMIDFALYQPSQIALYFISYILYYIGWEFLFRGLGLFSLTKGGINPLSAILITTLISALIHTSIAGFGKPMIETLSAIFAGGIFGYITYKTRSIYYSLYMHALVGIFTDVFIYLLC